MIVSDWLLTPGRAAVHVPTQTAVVADVHLGYDRIRARGGEAIPSVTIAEELVPLAECLRETKISRLLIAGDLFEDARRHRTEMEEELHDWLAKHEIELVGVVPGNHDRGLIGSTLPVVKEAMLGTWHVIHGDGPAPEGPFVQGHEHPLFRLRPGVEGPCYLVSETHLVLPAYSANAAGGNVLGAARWAKYRAVVIAGAEVLDFGEVGRIATMRR